MNLVAHNHKVVPDFLFWGQEAGTPLAEGRPEALESLTAPHGQIGLCRAAQGLCDG